MGEKTSLVGQVADAIVDGLSASDPGAYFDLRDNLHVVDGAFDMTEVAKAVLAAVSANLKGRIAHDEEGVLAMLDGGKGPLE